MEVMRGVISFCSVKRNIQLPTGVFLMAMGMLILVAFYARSANFYGAITHYAQMDDSLGGRNESTSRIVLHHADVSPSSSNTYNAGLTGTAAAGVEAQQDKKYVLLVTYGRSGSSFTSAVINAHPNVFYTFEPLYGILKTWSNTSGRSLELESTRMIDSFITCDFDDAKVFNNFQLKNSNDTHRTYYCLAAKADGFKHLNCFLEMWRKCKSKSVTFVKTIRLRVAWTQRFLEKYPNFKLLFLIRDPRAVLYSQSKVFRNFDWKTQVKKVSEEYCLTFEQDLEIFKTLLRLYPNRVKAIRYEDGAMDPMGYANEIFDFLDMKLTEDVKKKVIQMTTGSDPNVPKGKKINGSYTLFKKDPKKAMNRWRGRAGYTSVQLVDAACGELYPALGYSKVTSQKDLESERQLVLHPKDKLIFYNSSIS